MENVPLNIQKEKRKQNEMINVQIEVEDSNVLNKRKRLSETSQGSSQEFPGLICNGRGHNMTLLYNVAEVARRYSCTSRSVAALLSAFLLDLSRKRDQDSKEVLFVDEQKDYFFDHKKVS